jgi:hypothetical protein
LPRPQRIEQAPRGLKPLIAVGVGAVALMAALIVGSALWRAAREQWEATQLAAAAREAERLAQQDAVRLAQERASAAQQESQRAAQERAQQEEESAARRQADQERRDAERLEREAQQAGAKRAVLDRQQEAEREAERVELEQERAESARQAAAVRDALTALQAQELQDRVDNYVRREWIDGAAQAPIDGQIVIAWNKKRRRAEVDASWLDGTVPERLRAPSWDDVCAIAYVECWKERWGKYSNGQIAWVVVYDVTVVDVRLTRFEGAERPRIVDSRQFRGGDPPELIYARDPGQGAPPSKDVSVWLQTLIRPRR